MKTILTLALVFNFALIYAQPNCEAFKYYGDDLKCKACKVAEKRSGHYQFSRAYQEALDESLAIDSTFAYAYKVKSTAYLKSGDFITWKKLIDKAVLYDPEGELFYRGWCRYQFFRDYKGAIADIERLDSLVNYDIGYSQNGDYHLHVARALCYKALGQPHLAIDIITKQLQDSAHMEGIFDYLHLGVLYLEVGNFEEALSALKKQVEVNDIAENRFYMAIAHKNLGQTEESLFNLQEAKKKYENNNRMLDPYVEQMDKIYLEDIEKEIGKFKDH